MQREDSAAATSPAVPVTLTTERLQLRRWQASDAAALLPLLQTNAEHLNGWIPRHVAEAVPEPALAARLAEFGRRFDANREWRYAILARDGTLLGEVDLFPRAASGRVALPEADRAEIGYWLRADYNGRGLATEAARALLELAATLPAVHSVEIRCDARNERSAAVPRRLGFRLLAAGNPGADGADHANDMVWCYDL